MLAQYRGGLGGINLIDFALSRCQAQSSVHIFQAASLIQRVNYIKHVQLVLDDWILFCPIGLLIFLKWKQRDLYEWKAFSESSESSEL